VPPPGVAENALDSILGCPRIPSTIASLSASVSLVVGWIFSDTARALAQPSSGRLREHRRPHNEVARKPSEGGDGAPRRFQTLREIAATKLPSGQRPW